MKVFTHPSHLGHTTDRAFPPYDSTALTELPIRVDLILKGAQSVMNVNHCHPSDFGSGVIECVHTKEYIKFLATAFESERLLYPDRVASYLEYSIPNRAACPSDHYSLVKSRYLTDIFTLIYEGTYHAAYWAAQCSVAACNEIIDGAELSYALIRPSGHHAYADQGGGYCYLNNAAIAAKHYQNRKSGAKVAILDIDFHHGNGTQEIFYDDASVLFCSIHGHPSFAYPHVAGLDTETGRNSGRNTTYNTPLPYLCGEDLYLTTLANHLEVIANFAPECLILSLGFDIAEGDPYGGFKIGSGGFKEIGKRIQSTELPIVIIQEGGYRLDTLQENSAAFFCGLVAG